VDPREPLANSLAKGVIASMSTLSYDTLYERPWPVSCRQALYCLRGQAVWVLSMNEKIQEDPEASPHALSTPRLGLIYLKA
jgi:hypothetical protein